MDITPLNTDFAGDVTGIDLTRPLTAQQVAAIEAGMDRFAVLVFHDQHFDDDTQLAFSRNFGELEISSGGEMSKAGGPAAEAGNGRHLQPRPRQHDCARPTTGCA